MLSGPSRSRRIVFWGSSLPALLAASYLYLPHAFTGPVFCPMALMLGLPCPGCGLTRAFGLATHGRFREAFQYHAIWPLLLAYLGFLWIYEIMESVRGEPPKLPASTSRIGAAMIFTLFGFWAVRLAWFFTHNGLAVIAHDNALARLVRLLE